MEFHLGEGCQECKRTFSMWSLILEHGRREREYTPSEDDVELVKRAFQGRTHRATSVLTDLAHLVFDSFLQPSLAMVRSGVATNRQLVFEAGSVVIDLQIQPEPGGRRSFLLGQVLTKDETAAAPEEIKLRLMSAERELGQAIATEDGEFEFHLGQEPHLSLSIDIPGRNSIVLAVPSDEQSVGSDNEGGGSTG